MSRLTFTEGNHAYWLADPAGKKQRITSVTTLLGQQAKPQLVAWAAREAADYATDNWDALTAMAPSERRKLIAKAADKTRNAKAAKGTAIHSMAEELLAGRPVEVAADLLPKVESLARWLERCGLTFTASERLVWSDEDDEVGLCAYGGKLDAIAESRARGIGILDWKTGSGVYGDMTLQLAGYDAADWHVVDGVDVPASRVTWAGIVHIRPDGCDLHTIDAAGLAAARARFDALRALKLLDTPALTQEA